MVLFVSDGKRVVIVSFPNESFLDEEVSLDLLHSSQDIFVLDSSGNQLGLDHSLSGKPVVVSHYIPRGMGKILASRRRLHFGSCATRQAQSCKGTQAQSRRTLPLCPFGALCLGA